MDSPDRPIRYSDAVSLEIKHGNLRGPIWEQALAEAHGDRDAAETLYFVRRVEQMERDETIQETEHLAKSERREVREEKGTPRIMVKTLLFAGTALVSFFLLFMLFRVLGWI